MMGEETIDFNVGVVLPAGGTGNRTGLKEPKQYYIVSGKPLIFYTIQTFHRLPWIQYIIVTVAESSMSWMEEFVKKHNFHKVHIIAGGDTRHRSIFNGVKHVESVCSEPDVILIHDAVRLFVKEDITKKIARSAKLYGASGVTNPLVSTVISVGPDGFLTESLDRTLYRGSEMPQAFQYGIIRNAYEKCNEYDFLYGTECLLLAMKYSNVKAQVIESESTLWKVTHKRDIYAADGIIKENLHQTYLTNVKAESEIYSKFQKHFTDKNMKIENITPGSLNVDTLPFKNIIHFASGDDLNIENITTLYSNESSFSNSGIDMIVVVYEVPNSYNLSQTLSSLTEKCRNLSKRLLSNDGIILNLIFFDEKNVDRLADCCRDLVWNRNSSLNGQTLVITGE